VSNSNNIKSGIYRPEFERDNCGFGLIAHMDGEPSHWLLDTAIGALARLTHRGAVAADGKSGDGCGLLIGKPAAFLETVAAEQDITLADNWAAGKRTAGRRPGSGWLARRADQPGCLWRRSAEDPATD
jgi:glutamate synthase (NADPH/NADH) large chain